MVKLFFIIILSLLSYFVTAKINKKREPFDSFSYFNIGKSLYKSLTSANATDKIEKTSAIHVLTVLRMEHSVGPTVAGWWISVSQINILSP